MAPHWFELVAWAALGLGFVSALVIAVDIFLLGYRQHLAIMNLVFPLTALYMGPLAIWLCLARGRRMSHKQMQAKPDARGRGARLAVAGVALRHTHCGGRQDCCGASSSRASRTSSDSSSRRLAGRSS